MWIYISMSIVAILLLLIFSIRNGIVKLNNKVEEAFSTMDVYLKKRWDLIPNIVETVKGCIKNERDVLVELTKLRSASYESMVTDEKVNVNNKLTKDIDRLVAVTESYPELKSNENFKYLSEVLVQIENDIANSRKYYNGTVRIYNNKVQMFPSNIVAEVFGYKPRNMFEISKIERDNVKIDV